MDVVRHFDTPCRDTLAVDWFLLQLSLFGAFGYTDRSAVRCRSPESRAACTPLDVGTAVEKIHDWGSLDHRARGILVLG